MKLLTNRLLRGEGWRFGAVPASGSGVLSLADDGGELCRWCGAKLNNLAETDALNRKFRYHETVEQCSAELEIASVWPFGGEPEIRRVLEVIPGLIRERLDFTPGASEVIRDLEPERFLLPGRWKRFGTVAIPEAGQSPEPVQWRDASDAAAPFWSGSQPFLLIAAERADGSMVEIGLGEDLWRWNALLADNLPAFTAAMTQEGIQITLAPLHLAAEAEVQRRPWRYTLYCAWRPGTAGTTPDLPGPTEMLPELPEAGRVRDRAGRAVAAGCWISPCGRRALRKRWRIVGKGHLKISAPLPLLCADGGHLERTGKTLLHWDYPEMQDFYAWCARRTGCGILWQWQDAAWAELPSAWRLARPLTGKVTVAPAED